MTQRKIPLQSHTCAILTHTAAYESERSPSRESAFATPQFVSVIPRYIAPRAIAAWKYGSGWIHIPCGPQQHEHEVKPTFGRIRIQDSSSSGSTAPPLLALGCFPKPMIVVGRSVLIWSPAGSSGADAPPHPSSSSSSPLHPPQQQLKSALAVRKHIQLRV